MAMLFIRSMNLMINTDHIVRAEFFPAHVVEEHIDEETERWVPERSYDAMLKIVTTEMEPDVETLYGGDPVGVTNKNVALDIRRYYAEKVWEYLKLDAEDVEMAFSTILS